MTGPDNPPPPRADRTDIEACKKPVEVWGEHKIVFFFWSNQRTDYKAEAKLEYTKATKKLDYSPNARAVVLHHMICCVYWYQAGRVKDKDQAQLRRSFWRYLPICQQADYDNLESKILKEVRDKVKAKFNEWIKDLSDEMANLGVWRQGPEFITADSSGAFNQDKVLCDPVVAKMFLYQATHKDFKGKLMRTGGNYGINVLINTIKTSARESPFGEKEWLELRNAVVEMYEEAKQANWAVPEYAFRFTGDEEKDLAWLAHVGDFEG